MLILKKIALIAPIMIRWVSIGCLFKSPMTALPWKRGPVRGKCSGSTLSPAGFLFVCDILRCNAMPRLTPGCDVTHFDWQLHCSAGFNSFLSGDSAANPREKRRPRDTNTHTHTHLTPGCKLPQSPFDVYQLQWKLQVGSARCFTGRMCVSPICLSVSLIDNQSHFFNMNVLTSWGLITKANEHININ